MKKENTIENLKTAELHPFPDNPFGMRGEEEQKELYDSIRENGIVNPLIVRPRNTGGYEILSGHRRHEAAKTLGLETVPALIRDVSDDEAVILLVDSNLNRNELLPSEKAFAYKMKLEAIKHQGKATSTQVGQKLTSVQMIADQSNDSRSQVQRYIRLTHLIRPLLDMVDERRIALTPAVELSYLGDSAQRCLCDAMDYYDCTPSYSQTVRMHRISDADELDEETIYSILGEEKANQRERLTIDTSRIRRYFPDEYTVHDMEEAIMRLLEEELKRIRKKNSRDER